MSANGHAKATTRCLRCDAPIYAGETDCHYCGGGGPIDSTPLMIGLLVFILAGVLALAIIGR